MCIDLLRTFFVRFRDLGHSYSAGCMRRQLSTRLPLLQIAIHVMMNLPVIQDMRYFEHFFFPGIDSPTFIAGFCLL